MRRPAYYDKFKCKAGDCTDSCCKGWEIDIDDETGQYYDSLPGAFGDRLRKALRQPVEYEDDWEPAHFELTAQRRCPFLNDAGLCDIILTLGEEAISEVCTNHPRYYDWLTQTTEAGVGLACEEAARLILTDETPGLLVEDGPAEEETTRKEAAEEGSELESLLYDLRQNIIGRIAGAEESLPAGAISDAVYEAAVEAQNILDDYLYGEQESDLEEKIAMAQEKETWTALFWSRETAAAADLVDFYLGLDINTEEWRQELLRLKAGLPEVVSVREQFRVAYPEAEGQYRRLMIYFIYRYLMRARYDEYLLERVLFALISVDVIEMMDIRKWLEEERFQLWDQICVCKLYSQEIEYDSDNVDLVSTYLTGDGKEEEL